MSTFDYFVGELKCPSCGYISKNDARTNIQTKISKYPSLSELSVGQRIDANWGDICAAGYFLVNQPLYLDSIILLETWECPECDQTFNWAQISINSGKIESIESIELSRSAIYAVNYITDDCRFLLPEGNALDSAVVDRLLIYLDKSR